MMHNRNNMVVYNWDQIINITKVYIIPALQPQISDGLKRRCCGSRAEPKRREIIRKLKPFPTLVIMSNESEIVGKQSVFNRRVFQICRALHEIVLPPLAISIYTQIFEETLIIWVTVFSFLLWIMKYSLTEFEMHPQTTSYRETHGRGSPVQRALVLQYYRSDPTAMRQGLLLFSRKVINHLRDHI